MLALQAAALGQRCTGGAGAEQGGASVARARGLWRGGAGAALVRQRRGGAGVAAAERRTGVCEGGGFA